MHIFLPKSTFINLSNDIQFAVFSFKMARKRKPVKGVTLNHLETGKRSAFVSIECGKLVWTNRRESKVVFS